MVKFQDSKLPVFIVIASFLLGWLGSNIYNGIPSLQLEKPFAIGFSNKISSPYDRVKDQNIRLFDDKIVIYIKELYLAKFTDTHSMEPVLDRKSTGLEIVPKSSNEIRIGDIISYDSQSGETIIHRVAKIGNDSEGWYAITKGDNNKANDDEKIRFKQVKRVLVGVLY